jgi:probable F420-dependent oxidoreductase
VTRAPSLGLFALNQHAGAGALARIGPLAEELGYDSVWVGEHVAVPDPHRPPSPMQPRDPILDPLVALAFLAARTTHLRLATGIVILPQRNPVVLAKQLASLDVLAGGRFTLGVGVGYLEPEFRAIGANFAERGPVTDEFLDAMASLWYDERPEFHGRFADFAGVDAHPRPVQRPIPVVVGGHRPPAFRRAVARAQGWYGFALTPEDVATCIEGLRRAADAVERPGGLGPLEVSVTPRGRLTAETVAAFAELAVHRLVPMPRPTASAEDIEALVESSLAAVAGAGGG